MKRLELGSLATLATGLFVASAPMVAHACPMCFASGENNDAFLYGSLFLMFVPVTSLGGLAYWAYRRIKANEQGDSHPDDDAPVAPQHGGRDGVVLQISPRR